MRKAKSLFHSANHAINFLTRSAARNAVKEKLRGDGVRLSLVPTRQVHAQAEEYLANHPELYVLARERAQRMGYVDLQPIMVTPDCQTALSVIQVAQSRALKRLNFSAQLLRFSSARAYYLRSNAVWGGPKAHPIFITGTKPMVPDCVGTPMTGFGIEETADSFILRRGDEEIRMSKEVFFSLRSQMNLWTERRLLEYQARSGEVRQIVSHPIAWVDVWPDAIQENVLLILSLTETQVVFSLPIPIAGGLVGALERVLSLMQTGPRA